MFSQASPRKPVPQPLAGAQMPSALLGCRQAWLSLSARQRGRRGVSEPAAASSPLSSVTSPRFQKACHSASCLTGPVEGKLGRGRVGVPAAGARLGKAGRDRQEAEAGPHHGVRKARSCEPGSHTATHSHAVRRTLSLPDVCRQRGPSSQRGSVPGLVPGRSPQQQRWWWQQ